MHMLLADPDRDFLEAFQTLLMLNGHTVSTVFDGTQVITKLSHGGCDILILNEDIPRIPARELIRLCRDKQIPVIVLTEQRIHSDMLSDEPLAHAYLPLPFLPQELTDTIERVMAQKKSEESLHFEDAVIEVPSFSLCRTLPVTEGEISVFRALLYRQPMNYRRAGPYMTALNHKLAKLHKNVCIKYLIHDGYRLVKINYE